MRRPRAPIWSDRRNGRNGRKTRNFSGIGRPVATRHWWGMPTADSRDDLTDDERRRAVALVKGRGTVAAARALGVSRESLARICANLPCRRGTLALLRQGLAALDAGDTGAA